MLLLIDGNSIMNRAFYALPLSMSSGGVPTNAVYGFMTMFYKAVEMLSPDEVLVAFDRNGPTFRHANYTEYKAGRRAMPSELSQQFPILKDLLDTLEICRDEIEGQEADDIIGTMAKKAEASGKEVVILTGDRDALQLISDMVTVLLTKKGLSETALMNIDALQESLGITPAQVIDLKALMGDSSDNIPGVPGVGEKSALKLLAEYHTLDNLYENVASVPGKLGEKLVDNKELAYLSKELATIHLESPVRFTPEECAYHSPRGPEAAAAFQKLGFKSLMARLEEDVPVISNVEVHTLQNIAELQGEYIAVYTNENTISFSCDGLSEYSEDFMGSPAYVIEKYRVLLSDKKVIAFNAKPLMHALRDLNVADLPVFADVFIAEYLIDSNAARYDLDRLINRYTPGYPAGAAAVYQIWFQQYVLLENEKLLHVYEQIELPLTRVLFEMERVGFMIDREALKELQVEFSTNLDALSEAIYALAGGSFNINSTKQLAEVLFGTLQLPSFRKTKTGQSTDSEVLEQLADKHPIIPLIMEYRTYGKLKSTYVDGVLQLTQNSAIIHTSLQQTVASTGRISSTEPNLQNIPVRSELGKRIRGAFVSRGEEYLLVDADYSQIELRVLAHMAGDAHMIEAFRQGRDIHASTAAEVFGVPLEDVTSHQRSMAKAVNFGVVYGISDFGLSRNLGITRKQAGEFIAQYFERYPSIKDFMSQLKQRAHDTGYAETLFGRRRYIPELKAANHNTKMFGERIAMNMPIQGTAADIIKLAMVRLSGELKNQAPKSDLILQVHDELIVDTHISELDLVKKLLRDSMMNVVSLEVPLEVDIAAGRSWLETKG